MPKTTYVHLRIEESLKRAYTEALELNGISCTQHLTKEIEKMVQKSKRLKKNAG